MSHIEYDGPGSLHIVDISEARTMDKSSFDRVVTVCQDSIEDNVPREIPYSYYCMSDGPANEYGGDHSYELFQSVAGEVYRALSNDESVLLHCHMGQSRSVSVAVAALGRLLDKRSHESFGIIRDSRGQAHPDELLMAHAKTYIENWASR